MFHNQRRIYCSTDHNILWTLCTGTNKERAEKLKTRINRKTRKIFVDPFIRLLRQSHVIHDVHEAYHSLPRDDLRKENHCSAFQCIVRLWGPAPLLFAPWLICVVQDMYSSVPINDIVLLLHIILRVHTKYTLSFLQDSVAVVTSGHHNMRQQIVGSGRSERHYINV